MPSVRSRPLIRLLTLLAALGLLLTACGDDSGDDGNAAPDTDTETETETDSDRCPADVCMEGIAFTETEVAVAVGDTVTWTNLDPANHTVTAGNETDPRPDEFDSGNLGGDDSFEHTFEAAGSFDYYCEVHPQMEGTVVVE